MKVTWEDTRRLFERALDLPAAERAEFVRRSSGADPDLATDVLELLEADAGEDPLLDGDATRLLTPNGGDGPRAVGGYRLLEVLGEGGTSTVYRARGADGDVALKLLHPGLVHGELHRRFEDERHVLAALEHPGIVTLRDAGTHGDRPYLVTELVRGRRIDEACEGRPLDERLALFAQVAEAVHHAHARLVVHRDLKPGNVLVTDDGRVKVLDFGVAKLLDAGDGHTQPGGRAPMTPAYASPEQRRGEAVTTATDVYSLGVLLRELAGAHGEIGTVVACATDDEPGRRYASAHELADDVRRVLARRPLSARKPSVLYAARRWVRREPVAAALSAAGVLALLLSLVVLKAGLDSARAGESLAWGAHADAVYVTHTWADLLEQVARGEVAGRDDVLAKLAETEERLSGYPAERPEAEARTRAGLARVYAALGEHALAEPHVRRALELSRTTRGLGARDVRSNLALMAEVQLGLGDAGATETVAELLSLVPSDDPDRERAEALATRARQQFAR